MTTQTSPGYENRKAFHVVLILADGYSHVSSHNSILAAADEAIKLFRKRACVVVRVACTGYRATIRELINAGYISDVLLDGYERACRDVEMSTQRTPVGFGIPSLAAA